MKNKIYIIPGLGENCNLVRYKALSKALQNKGYTVINVNPNWYNTLSEQIFPIKKNSILCGFSFGAVFAYLIAKKYPCKKVIFASISPIHLFSYESLKKEYMQHMDEDVAIKLAKEIKNIKISLNKLKSPYITLVGSKEEMLLRDNTPNIIVPNSRHYMTKNYIKCIQDLI